MSQEGMGISAAVYRASQELFCATAANVSRDHAPRGAFFARLGDGRAPAIRPGSA